MAPSSRSPFPTLSRHLAVALLLVVLASGCARHDPKHAADPPDGRPAVLDDGMRIVMSDAAFDSTYFSAIPLAAGRLHAEATAPARVVARAAGTQSGEGGTIILFDSPDVTSLYSQYNQSVATLSRARNDLQRMRDMFDNNAATSRDVLSAETDVANAVTARSEIEGKLRALGFNPAEFGRLKAGTTYLISDVPEALLNEVQLGERTIVTLNSYPGETFRARVAAIGDVVDNATRTVKVRVEMRGTGGREVRPGMFATVNYGQSQTDAFMVPLQSVVTVMGKDYVFVRKRREEYERREVQLGKQIGGEVAIIAGLRSGEEVVVKNAMMLKGLSFGY